jgi:hypothetical protein
MYVGWFVLSSEIDVAVTIRATTHRIPRLDQSVSLLRADTRQGFAAILFSVFVVQLVPQRAK